MGDAYGHIMCVGKFSGDKAKVMKALNLFLWNSDHEHFRCEEDRLYLDGLVQYPSIFPYKKVVHDDNDEIVDVEHPAYNGELPDDWYIEDGIHTDLEELVKAISPFLESGEITISMNSTYRSFSMSSGTLTIRSDMTGTRRYMSSSSDGSNRDETENYP